MTYSEVLVELTKSVPNLVVFLMLVYFLTKGQKQIAEKLSDGIVTYMRAKDKEVQRVIEQNSRVIEDNSETLRENSKALGGIIAKLPGGI